jgi:glucan phosphoethanolaminetransferase (alkaline phosphatase superfamily)
MPSGIDIATERPSGREEPSASPGFPAGHPVNLRGNSKGFSRAWLATSPAILFWLFPALCGLYAKYQMLVSGHGLEIVERALNPADSSTPLKFSFWQNLSFYRMDLLVGFLLIPAFLLIIFQFLSPRWRLRLAALLSLAVGLALYIQIRAFGTAGSFVSLHTLRVALSWGWRDPVANISFLVSAKALVILALAVPLAALLIYRKKKVRTDALPAVRWTDSILQKTAVLIGVSAVLFTAISWVPRVTSNAFQRGAIPVILRAYLGSGPGGVDVCKVYAKEFSALTLSEMEQRYRQLAQAPLDSRDPAYWAKARGSNVIFFILETTPARFLDVTGDLASYPNIRELRDRSFVLAQHYTTYPITHRALFSLFGSVYPSPDDTSLAEKHAELALPGLFPALAAAGYQTAVYSPFRWTGEYDDVMFRGLGIQRQVYPDSEVFGESIGPGYSSLHWREMRIGRDRAALALMKQDLTAWLSRGTPFAAVYVPQIGHEPLPVASASGVHDEKEVLREEKIVLQTEDAWLGELFELLRRSNQLDNTLIVLAGDHGVRTSQEDPSFTPGMIDEGSFHVPLLIYAPQVLNQPKTISWVTSHIDIAPTMLDLLGLEGNRQLVEGTAVWNPALADRSTYLFAARMFGSDGYYSHGRFFMWNESTDFTYSNATLHFDTLSPLAQYSSAHARVAQNIGLMGGLQQAIEDKIAASYPAGQAASRQRIP